MFIELLSSERDNKFSFSVDTFWFCLTFLASQKHTSTLLVTLLTYWRSWSRVLQKWLLLLHFFQQSLYSNSTQVQIDCFLWHIRCLQWSPTMVSAEKKINFSTKEIIIQACLWNLCDAAHAGWHTGKSVCQCNWLWRQHNKFFIKNRARKFLFPSQDSKETYF